MTPGVAIGEEHWAMEPMGNRPDLGGLPLLPLGARRALVSPDNLIFH